MDASDYMDRTLDQQWHGTLGRREPEPPDAEETVRASWRAFHASDANQLDAEVDALLDGDDPSSDELPIVTRPSHTVARRNHRATAPTRDSSSSARVGAHPSTTSHRSER